MDEQAVTGDADRADDRYEITRDGRRYISARSRRR
jgi:hypothetical protein